jgi:hypothetical protein
MAAVRGIRFIPIHMYLTIGVVRVLTQDDHFEDYYFPKGTRFSNCLFNFNADFSLEF